MAVTLAPDVVFNCGVAVQVYAPFPPDALKLTVWPGQILVEDGFTDTGNEIPVLAPIT